MAFIFDECLKFNFFTNIVKTRQIAKYIFNYSLNSYSQPIRPESLIKSLL